MIGNIASDYHVHCGQFNDVYYSPSLVIEILSKSHIAKAWISSTSSCIEWNTEDEKKEIIHLIESEINEAVNMAKSKNIDLTPLYWVLPKRYFEGESIESIMDGSLYKGFKVHPKLKDWNINNELIFNLFTEICEYADKNKMPILIHTGEDESHSPDRFEFFYNKYKNVSFVLAHCKNYHIVVNLFRKYSNLLGDTAFCPLKSYKKICKAGFKNRMHPGTDFPITHWFEYKLDNKKINNTQENYNKIQENLNIMLNTEFEDWSNNM